MAVWLTNWENHRTASGYDNSLILKLAVFQCINTYFGLVYIAAIKNNITILGEHQYCRANAKGEPDCMGELQSQLAVMLVQRMVIRVATEHGMPKWAAFKTWMAKRWSLCCARAAVMSEQAVLEEAKKHSPFEVQAEYPTFATFDDYLYILIEFGLVTLFVTAFPLAPAIALIDAVLSMHTHKKRLFAHSRPLPHGATGIGSWKRIFTAICYLSAITNLAIVVFTNKAPIFGHDLDWVGRLSFFVVAQNVLLVLKWAVSAFVPPMSGRTERHLQRQAYLVDKHILGVSEDLAGVNQRGVRAAAEGATGRSVATRPVPEIREEDLAAPSYFAFKKMPDPRGAKYTDTAPMVEEIRALDERIECLRRMRDDACLREGGFWEGQRAEAEREMARLAHEKEAFLARLDAETKGLVESQAARPVAHDSSAPGGATGASGRAVAQAQTAPQAEDGTGSDAHVVVIAPDPTPAAAPTPTTAAAPTPAHPAAPSFSLSPTDSAAESLAKLEQRMEVLRANPGEPDTEQRTAVEVELRWILEQMDRLRMEAVEEARAAQAVTSSAEECRPQARKASAPAHAAPTVYLRPPPGLHPDFAGPWAECRARQDGLAHQLQIAAPGSRAFMQLDAELAHLREEEAKILAMADEAAGCARSASGGGSAMLDEREAAIAAAWAREEREMAEMMARMRAEAQARGTDGQ